MNILEYIEELINAGMSEEEAEKCANYYYFNLEQFENENIF